MDIKHRLRLLANGPICRHDTAAEAADLIEQQAAELERLRAENSKAIAEVGRIGRELGRAQAEADRLRADAERIDLVESMPDIQINYNGRQWVLSIPSSEPPYLWTYPVGDTLRAAIDAARGE